MLYTGAGAVVPALVDSVAAAVELEGLLIEVDFGDFGWSLDDFDSEEHQNRAFSTGIGE